MTEPKRVTDPETGQQLIVHESGVIQDARGRFIKGPNETPITRDPYGMLALRNAKSKQDARDAIDEEIYPLDPSKWGTGEGWKDLIKKCVSLIMQSKNARGVAELVGKVGTAAGYLSARDEPAALPDRNISATPAAIRELLVMLDEELQARITQAQAIEGNYDQANDHDG